MLVGRVKICTDAAKDNSSTAVVKFIEDWHVQVGQWLEEVLRLKLRWIHLAVIFDVETLPRSEEKRLRR